MQFPRKPIRSADPIGRLVSVHAAVVRRVADRRADVAPRFQAREAGGKRRRGAAGGPARYAADGAAIMR